ILGVKDPKVSLTVDGEYLKNVTIVDPNNPSKKTVWATSKDMQIDADQANEVFQTVLRTDADPNNPLNKPGIHYYTLTVQAPGRTAESVSGTIQAGVEKYEGAPVNHTFVKGIDLADGHLVSSSTDVSIAGLGPALQFARTYSGAKPQPYGPLGPG